MAVAPKHIGASVLIETIKHKTRERKNYSENLRNPILQPKLLAKKEVTPECMSG